MTTYEISIYGQIKGTVISYSEQSAMVKASFTYTNGNTVGISVIKLAD